jgi:hypothetical protein
MKFTNIKTQVSVSLPDTFQIKTLQEEKTALGELGEYQPCAQIFRFLDLGNKK